MDNEQDIEITVTKNMTVGNLIEQLQGTIVDNKVMMENEIADLKTDLQSAQSEVRFLSGELHQAKMSQQFMADVIKDLRKKLEGAPHG
jgi:hypothetical protein